MTGIVGLGRVRRLLVLAGLVFAVSTVVTFGVAAVTARAALAAAPNGYQAVVLADHPVAYWPMDDTSSTLTDATGNGNDGAYQSGVSFNQPSVLPRFPYDPSVGFSGSEDANVPTRSGAPAAADVTHLSGSFSVEAWVSPGVSSDGLGIFGSRTPGDQSFDFKLLSGGVVHGDLGNGSGWFDTSVDASNAAGDWVPGSDYYIVYVVDAATSSWSIYIDGAQAATGSVASSPLLSDANHVIQIGSTGWGGEFFQGWIGQVAVYSRPLPAAEISTHWKFGSLGDADLALSNVPANMTVNATGPTGAVVTYTPPTAADESGETPGLSCLPASGSRFPIGMTTVTCTATDADDSNSPVHASFTVTVKGGLAHGGGGRLTLSGQVGRLRLDHSSATAVIQFAGHPDASATGNFDATPADPNYAAMGYGCQEHGRRGLFLVDRFDYCQTVFFINAHTHSLAAFFSSSPRYSFRGATPGMPTRAANRYIHQRARAGCFYGYTLGRRRGHAQFWGPIDGGNSRTGWIVGGQLTSLNLESNLYPVGFVSAAASCP